MKATLTSIMLAATAFVSGCMSPGGVVIGPLSNLTAGQNERVLIRRSAAVAEGLTAAQKEKIFKVSASSTDAGDVAVQVGVDILQLRGAKLTAREVGRQALGVAGDVVLYGLAAWGAKEADLFGGDGGGGRSQTVNVSGDGNNVDVTGDTETQSTTTTTDSSTRTRN